MSDRVNVVGKNIVAVRKLTQEELERESWEGYEDEVTALVLNDGSLVFASSDGEGNNPGLLFIQKGGEKFNIEEPK